MARRSLPSKIVKKKRFERVPSEFHTVTPYLAIADASQVIDWCKRAFGAKEIEDRRQQTPDRKIIHARMRIGDSIVMLCNIFPGSGVSNLLEGPGRSPVTLHIYSKNVDRLWNHAIEAGRRLRCH